GVPFTLQTFGVILTGLVLGWKKGSAAVLVYLALGAVGLPVFSGFTGGIGSFAGATGGFLIGFMPLAALSGISSGKRKYLRLLSVTAGILLCHLSGVLWMSFVMDISVKNAFFLGSLPFIIKDILSAAGAFSIHTAIRKAVNMHKGQM
ncbi:MAG: biotin transporter BioY, partial [Oscillospiraceae bacterium]|nr:biotin transporter BioY [Oscillospiraceae bacterium]